MRNVFRQHPFLLIGLVSLCLFFVAEGLNRAGDSETGVMAGTLPPHGIAGQLSQTGGMRHALSGPIRVLIVPMYLAWMTIAVAQVAIVGTAGLVGPLTVLVGCISLVAGLAPYAFADYVLERWRQARARPPIHFGSG